MREALPETSASSSSQTRKKYLILLPIVVIVVAAAFVVALTAASRPPTAYAGLEARIQTALEAAKLKETRPDYLPLIVYQNLPPFPKDFYEIDTLVEEGILTDLSNIDGTYYLQPEFYPTWEEIVPHYQNPDQTRRGIVGYGAYPADIGVETSPGSEFTVVTFFHAGMQTETYQGMRLAATYPDMASIPTKDLQTTLPVNQDPAAAARYFTVTFDPETFVLEPSFPIFQAGWTRRIAIHVRVAEDTPSARYVIGVNPESPVPEQRTQWINQYRLKYVDAGGHYVGRPFFQLTIDVI